MDDESVHDDDDEEDRPSTSRLSSAQVQELNNQVIEPNRCPLCLDPLTHENTGPIIYYNCPRQHPDRHCKECAAGVLKNSSVFNPQEYLKMLNPKLRSLTKGQFSS